MNVEATRTNYTELANKLEELYGQNPDDIQVGLSYIEKLIQLGNVEKARGVLAPMLEKTKPKGQAIYLAGQIAYLSGEREEAEKLYTQLLNDYPEFEEEAETALEMIYYQTNQYQKAKTLSGKYASGKSRLMNAYSTTVPNTVKWDGTKESTVPFFVTNPLPVIEIEANGKPKKFLIDTGAFETYIVEDLARELGIESVASSKETYAGDVKVETLYGILDSMKLGSVTLESQPVNIANFGEFSALYDFPISGIIGKGVFKQFLATMDYIDEKLILRPRKAQIQTSPNAVKEPFIDAGRHFTLCKSKINGKEVQLFLDSGLAIDASLLLCTQAMQYTGVTLLEKVNTAEIEIGGLGGNDFDAGFFNADTYQFGKLPEIKDVRGLYGVFPDSYYFDKSMNTFVDGIVSHRFLKNYRWTIDYDAMTMTLDQ